ncbi:integrase, catalytic region, zinc finger, CCHC-type containing protein, partial [Tanacetum coccineum]
QCYNCGEKGHYAKNCPKPRVRDSKYFMEQMLLAKQDEAGVILTDEQNDFLFVDRDIIRDLEKQRDKLSQEVKHFKQKNEELQQSQLILKRKMSENEDKYHDTILDLEEKLKKNVDLFLKIECPKLYVASRTGNIEIPFNVRDSEETLEDAFKSQHKMNKKMNDPIAVANKHVLHLLIFPLLRFWKQKQCQFIIL